MTIKKKTAIKMAIEALQHRQKAFCFDANVFLIYGIHEIGGKRALKKIQRLNEAIAYMEEML